MKWYIKVMKKYAIFSGRAQRKEYWMFMLFNLIIAFAIGFILGFIEAILEMGTTLSSIASILYALAVFLPGLAVAVRRMHDIGRSGWWILCPILNFVFLFFDSQPDENEYGLNPKTS